MSDHRPIVKHGRTYVVRSSNVGNTTYYHVCPYTKHAPFGKSVDYLLSLDTACKIMSLIEDDEVTKSTNDPFGWEW